MLLKNIREVRGLFSLPIYDTLNQVITDSSGYFELDNDNTQRLKIVVENNSSYLIDSTEY